MTTDSTKDVITPGTTTCSKPPSSSSPPAATMPPSLAAYTPRPGAKPMSDIPKSCTFTSQLPADPALPDPASSHGTPRGNIMPRTVRGALYSYVRPVRPKDPELLAVSPAALRDLAISDPGSEEFGRTVAGGMVHGWEEGEEEGGKVYPWAQCYGGFQFGNWAGQLGDGRAISLFETTPPPPSISTTQQAPQPPAAGGEIGLVEGEMDYNSSDVPLRYEVQLKGAGLTPYSRFADGKAVLRSSIREFVVSEYLQALGIPTTRALSLSLLPHDKARRENGLEPAAIVCRFAQSWLRLGTFDLLRARGEREMMRTLATYVAEHVFGGWDKLPSYYMSPSTMEVGSPPRGLPGSECQGPVGLEENRFARLYREIVRRNARTVARWQAYGFMNGVLNTDNTSVYGLSMDFGPFAFMDEFDPEYTPNHDDQASRYCFRNQPTVIWWNLVRLGEGLGELIGAGPGVDADVFVETGVGTEEEGEGLVKRAEMVIERAGEEYKDVFMAEYKSLMTKRLGLKVPKEGDFEMLFSEALDVLELGRLDFHFFFRRLGSLRLAELGDGEEREKLAGMFFYGDGVAARHEKEVRRRMGAWLGKWRERVVEDWGVDGVVDEERDRERMEGMNRVNPSFVPRSWVLDEVIRRVEKEGERDVLRRVMCMSLHPFEHRWDGKVFDDQDGPYVGDEKEEDRWVGDVGVGERAMQCSCSS